MTATPRSVRRGIAVVVALLVVTSAITSLSFVVMAASEQEPNDSRDAAQSIPTGEQISGEIPSNDEDWFAFTVEKGETINVTAAADEGNRATEFNLVTPGGNNPEGARLAGESDFFGTTATTSGTYYVQVIGVSPNQGGEDYNFTVETYETDGFEPNEERANATGISVGQEASGTVSLGDEDWFAFTVEAGETINVSAAAAFREDRTTEFDLEVPNGNNPTGARLNGENATFGTTAETNGTYYVKVIGVSPSRGGGDYNFTVETYRTDDFEPNEDRRNATRLYENPLPSDGATVTMDDTDYFAFTAKAGETINVSAATAFREDRATEFDLEDPNDNTLTGARLNGENATFGTTAETNGIYYLEIRGVSGKRGGGDYNFTVDLPGQTLGLPNDRFERSNPPIGNQDRANATALEAGTYTGLGMVDDDRDVFAVELQSNERVTATINFTHADNDLSLVLQNASGQPVARSDTSTDNERLAVNATGTETHYLIVTGESGAATRYELNLTVTTVGPPVSVVGQYDGDGDGAIDQRELLGALADYDGTAQSSDPADGVVSPPELLELLANYQPNA